MRQIIENLCTGVSDYVEPSDESILNKRPKVVIYREKKDPLGSGLTARPKLVHLILCRCTMVCMKGRGRTHQYRAFGSIDSMTSSNSTASRLEKRLERRGFFRRVRPSDFQQPGGGDPRESIDTLVMVD